MPRAPAILTTLLLCSLSSQVQAASINSLTKLECKLLEFSAEKLSCEGFACTLSGNAALNCEETQLYADEVTIEFDQSGNFAGLDAQTGVRLINPVGSISCDQLSVAEDRVRGTVQNATLTLFETRRDGTNGIRATISGSIERIAETLYSLSPASISLCDCGPDSTPSWSVKATSIDVDTQDRALLYFPSLWLAPFGLFEVPVFPILAPISIPLKPRAFGFLPPLLRFYDALAPGLSIPLFIPLGDSYDLTVSVGNRFDWTPPRLNPWGEFAAPTLGMRLRYYPSKATKGQAEISGVYDRFHGNARNRHDTLEEAKDDLRYDLQRRFNIRAKHRWTPNRSTGLFADIQWTSDDLLLSDQALKYDDRITYYLPSRVQWFHDTQDWSIHVGFTHLQRLYNYQSSNPRSALNFVGHELDELSPGPVITGYLKPIQLNDWLKLEAVTELERIGPSSFTSDVKSQWRLAETLGLHASHIDYSTEFRASQNMLFALLPSPERIEPLAVSMTQFEISSPWRGVFNSFTHTFYPSLKIQHIQRLTEDHQIPTYLLESELDSGSQLMFKLGQHFSGRESKSPEFNLGLEVPFDLGEPNILPIRIVSQVKNLWKIRQRIALTLSPTGERLRDVTASFGWAPTSKLKLGADYLLLAPNASRFQSSLWSFASSESVEPDSENWIHGIRPTASLKLSDAIAATYRADIALPRKGVEDDELEIVLHSVGLRLKSSCHHCWDIEIKTQINPETTKSPTDIQLQIALSLGGFEISQ